jgi:hypothetical protein
MKPGDKLDSQYFDRKNLIDEWREVADEKGRAVWRKSQ